MKTMLMALNPDGIVGMAPYYLKSYYAGAAGAPEASQVSISGYDVACERQQALNDILWSAPDVLGFSCYVWNVEETLELCAAVKQELPDTKIVLGGPEVSARAMELMHRHASVDAIAVGEGEITFTELLRHWAAGERDLSPVAGLVFRRANQVSCSMPRGVIKDLSEVPSPFLTGIVDFDKLKGYLFGYETFRGCPFTCSFCYWGRMLSVRYFPMERVKEELAVILKSSLRRMWLGDAVANLHKKRFKEFLRAVIDLDTDTIIDFEMVADLLDEETIDLMGQLNDGYVAFGLQSINDKALATITRKWNREAFTKNVRMLRQRTDKIKIYIDLIYGLPEDSPQSYEDGIRYAMSLLPHKIQPHPLLMLPGSPMYDQPKEYGMVYEDRAPHYVVENKWWSRAAIADAAKWTDKLFVYFNPAVNLSTIMVSQLLQEDPLDVFNRLYAAISARIDPTTVATDIGLRREVALGLNDLLEEWIVSELTGDAYARYLPPLIDVMAFAGCKTMFYASDPPGEVAVPPLSRNSWYPTLSRHVVVKRFRHDMRAVYRANLLRSPDELLQLQVRTYDVVFNLLTHGVFHVSEHVSDLLAACAGERTLTELVAGLGHTRRVRVDEEALSDVERTFHEFARKQIVDSALSVEV